MNYSNNRKDTYTFIFSPSNICFMKKQLLIITLIFAFLMGSISIFAQKNEVKLKPREIRKLALVELEANGKKFPDSYLLGMRDDKMILLTDISRKWKNPLFVKSEITLTNYEYLTLTTRREKRKQIAIWGTIFGGLGYYIGKKYAQPTKDEVRNKLLLGQDSNRGIMEGVLGAITGAAFGSILGTHIAKKKMSLKAEHRQAIRKLKEFSYH